MTPGQVQDTLKFPKPVEQPPPAVPVEKQHQPPPAAAAGRTVQVSQFVFTGNTLYTQETLAALLSGYLNKPITLLDIYEAADKVTDFYSDHGYTLAAVNVPPQKLSGGTVRLDISEGVIGMVKVEGTSDARAYRIMNFLGDTQSGSIYHGPQLEAGLQNVNQLPGLSARAVVQPGREYGTTDLVIKTEEKPLTGNVFVDNYGTQAIGQTRVAANVILNNPARIEDQLNLLVLRSSGGRLQYEYAGYSLPLNYAATRLNLAYGHARFEVPGSVEGSNDNGKVEVAQPLLRTRTDRLDVSAAVSRTNSNAEISGTGLPLSGTSITLLELNTAYNHVYRNYAVTQLTANIATNFDHANTAAEVRPVAAKASNADQRFRLEIDAQQLQPLVEKYFLLAHLNGEWSPDPLSNATQYSIGGPQSVRAYATSEVRGDQGYLAQLTLGRNIDAGPVKFTGRLFADSGRVFCADASPDCKAESLSSAGVGLDAAWWHLSGKVDYSLPIDPRTPSDGHHDGRLFGSLFVNF
ncbi:MAG TPA: ShlB/FhaC/HecB family hemolysin secretion/activation protein [Nevskiaceae bacterium]|nr:ShlB/FhaC/HecB family hemolysin secretion/activation protein [Nevskiaceae bacterium]